MPIYSVAPETLRRDIPGLTDSGSTAQTIALADVLSRSRAARTKLRSILDHLETELAYSGEDGDRTRFFAAHLAGLIREYDGPDLT